jgi:phospholipase C
MGLQQGTKPPTTPLLGNDGKPAQGRCGYGTRMPLLVISPYAKANYIDHTLTDQTSVLRFIEDNWLKGARIQAGGSFDTIAGPINNMFDFSTATPASVRANQRKLMLDPATGRAN